MRNSVAALIESLGNNVTKTGGVTMDYSSDNPFGDTFIHCCPFNNYRPTPIDPLMYDYVNYGTQGELLNAEQVKYWYCPNCGVLLYESLD